MYMHTSLVCHIIDLYKSSVFYSFIACTSIYYEPGLNNVNYLTGIDIYVKIVYVKSYVYRAVRECGYVNKSSPKRCRPWLSSTVLIT